MKTKKIIYTLFLIATILCAVGCDNKKEIKRFRLSSSIGKLQYQNVFAKVLKDYDTITMSKAIKLSDSIYEVEINKTIEIIYEN